MAESFENLADWENEDLEKSLAEAVDSYDKQEEEKKKTRFSVENDLTRIAIFVPVKVANFEIKGFFSVYFLIFYYIKQIDSMLPCVCSVIGHRGRQNVVRTSVTHSAAPRVPLFCSYHILTSSVIYY